MRSGRAPVADPPRPRSDFRSHDRSYDPQRTACRPGASRRVATKGHQVRSGRRLDDGQPAAVDPAPTAPAHRTDEDRHSQPNGGRWGCSPAGLGAGSLPERDTARRPAVIPCDSEQPVDTLPVEAREPLALGNRSPPRGIELNGTDDCIVARPSRIRDRSGPDPALSGSGGGPQASLDREPRDRPEEVRRISVRENALRSGLQGQPS